MGKTLIVIVAFFTTFPFLATWMMFWLGNKIYAEHKWKAIHFSINWTTIFYLFAVITMLKMIFDTYFLGILLVLLLIILSIIIIIQWRTRMEILMTRALKQLWRVCFLLSAFFYVILVVIGIIKQII